MNNKEHNININLIWRVTDDHFHWGLEKISGAQFSYGRQHDFKNGRGGGV